MGFGCVFVGLDGYSDTSRKDFSSEKVTAIGMQSWVAWRSVIWDHGVRVELGWLAWEEEGFHGWRSLVWLEQGLNGPVSWEGTSWNRGESSVALPRARLTPGASSA